jgi:phospholipase C
LIVAPVIGLERSARRAALAAAGAAGLLFGPLACAQAASGGIHDIRHVVMIMQENRSFDSYFGTYPGVNGIPASVCVPDPVSGGCVKPFHDRSDVNTGGPHGTQSSIEDIDGGRMDGFVAQAEKGLECTSTNPSCSVCNTEESEGGEEGEEGQLPCVDVMGYHDAREIPNYWTYAHEFVLQDDMFESAASWSLPEHLYLVSAWSAVCPRADPNPLDCVGSLEPVHPGLGWEGPIVPGKATYAWTDITYLLHKANVSWRYYVLAGDEPDCEIDEAMSCLGVAQDYQTPGIWNPLADFTDVNEDGQRGDIQPLVDFYKAVHTEGKCALPAVSWIAPNSVVSEHPPASIAKGQAYVTTLINSIMRSPCWDSSAIFLSWDDWGGFYDNVQPPVIDANGYGMRVPGLVISPYAKQGYIDNQQLSHDAYLKFIEDDFLSSDRLNPKTDGRPDNRPDVREEAPGLGNLVNDFDFSRPPREPLLLPPEPPPGPPSEPPGGVPNPPSIGARAVSALTPTSATLNAAVDPDEASVSACRFEYGSSPSYGTTLPCATLPGSGELPVAVSAALSGLSAGTTYYFRAVATNPGGTSYGAPQAFTTARTGGLPEAGECTKLPAATGGYEDKACTTQSAGHSGHYEWHSGTASTLEAKAENVTLGPSGKWQVRCNKAVLAGRMTGARTVRAALLFTKCAAAGVGVCQSAFARAAAIKSYPLEGELGFATEEGSTVVGFDLGPGIFSFPTLVKYECGDSETGFQTSETGSAIGLLEPLDSMTKRLTLTYRAHGAQIPENLESQPRDTLVASVHVNGGAALEEPSTWNIPGSGPLGEWIEVKTR